MESTCLNLLTRDGAVVVTFWPALEGEHYSELHAAVCDAETADELRGRMLELADKWGNKVEIE
jgi:hypothetical protein